MYSSKAGSGRRRWTDKQRQRFLARFHQSQLTERDFATRHGVGLSTLSKWLRVESEAALLPMKFQEVIYTLLGSCRRQGINPFDYLEDLFTRLPAAKITQIKEFPPAAWAKAQSKLVAQAA